LVERGVAATSLEHVAQRSGVTRATIYRRYANKEDLFVAAVEAAYGNPPDEPQIADVEHMIDGWAMACSQPVLRRLMRRLYAASDDYPALAAVFATSIQPRRDKARLRVLEAARQRGELPPGTDTDLVLQLMTGAVWHHLVAYPDDTPTAEVRAYLHNVLAHVGYRRSQPR
jgi:AcrR family transcriptional regulator